MTKTAKDVLIIAAAVACGICAPLRSEAAVRVENLAQHESHGAAVEISQSRQTWQINS